MVTKLQTRQQFSVLNGIISEGETDTQTNNSPTAGLVIKSIPFNGAKLNAGQARSMIAKATGAKVMYMPNSERESIIIYLMPS